MTLTSMPSRARPSPAPQGDQPEGRHRHAQRAGRGHRAQSRSDADAGHVAHVTSTSAGRSAPDAAVDRRHLQPVRLDRFLVRRRRLRQGAGAERLAKSQRRRRTRRLIRRRPITRPRRRTTRRKQRSRRQLVAQQVFVTTGTRAAPGRDTQGTRAGRRGGDQRPGQAEERHADHDGQQRAAPQQPEPDAAGTLK